MAEGHSQGLGGGGRNVGNLRLRGYPHASETFVASIDIILTSFLQIYCKIAVRR